MQQLKTIERLPVNLALRPPPLESNALGAVNGPDIVRRGRFFFVVVRPNDSLVTIARRFGKSDKQSLSLARINKIGGSRLKAGQYIQVPASWVFPEKAAIIREDARRLIRNAAKTGRLGIVRGGALGDWFCPEGYTPLWADDDDEFDPFECVPDPDYFGTDGGDQGNQPGNVDPWGTGCGGYVGDYYKGYVDGGGNCVPCGEGRVFDQAKQACIDDPQKKTTTTTTTTTNTGGTTTTTDTPPPEQPGILSTIGGYLKKPAVIATIVAGGVVAGAVAYKRSKKRGG